MTVEENIDIAGENPTSDEPGMSTDKLFCSGERAALLNDIRADIDGLVPVIVLSGAKGEGKSSLCRMLVEQAPADCRVIYFEKTVESFEDVVRVIAARVDCGEVDVSRMAMSSTIDQIGAQLRKLNIRIVVIFDEAEMIYLATLERIRKMLDQLNEAEVRMQAVVSGRPLLLEHLTQLSIVKFRETDEKQYVLNPLNESDTAAFVEYLTELSAEPTEQFSPHALSLMYQITEGNVDALVECFEALLESDDIERELEELASALDHKESFVSSILAKIQGLAANVKHIPRRTLAIGAGVCLALIMIVMLFSGEDEQQKVTEDSPPPPPQIEQSEPVPVPPKEKEVVKKEEIKTKKPVETLDPAKKEVHKGKVEPEFKVAKKPTPEPPVVEAPPVQKKKAVPPPPPPPPAKKVVAEEVKPAPKPIVVEKEAEKKKPVKEAVKIGTAVVAGEAVVDAAQEKESEVVKGTTPAPVKPEEKISSTQSKTVYTPPPVQLEIDEPEIPHLHPDKEKHLMGVDEQVPEPAPREIEEVITDTVSVEPEEVTTEAVVEEIDEPTLEAEREEPQEQITETLPPEAEVAEDEVVLQVMTPNTPPLIVAAEKKVIHTPPIEVEPAEEIAEVTETIADTPAAPPVQEEEVPEPVAPPPPAKKIEKPVVETAVVAPKIKESYGSINSEAILANRIAATKSWLSGEKDDKYTIQLLILTSMFAEEKITNILSRREYAQAARNFYVLERNGANPAYFVYYGEYDDLNEAKRAQSTIPLFLRNHRPYVLSVPSAIEKMDN